MATLQKIRSHGVLLLVIVGVAMLAFILGDFLTNSNSIVQSKRDCVCVIEGEAVNFRTYSEKIEQLNEVYKLETGNNNLDDEATWAIRNQVWEFMRLDMTLRAEGEKIGMDVTKDELNELLKGATPHQLITSRPLFMDQDGQFSHEQLDNFLQYLNQEDDEEAGQGNTDAKNMYKQYWDYWKNVTRLTRMQEKYANLVQTLITANNIDAKYQFIANQTSVDAQYVMQPYSAISDSTITVDDAELKKLYTQRKKLYKQEPNRTIEYISFAVVPSEDDLKETENQLQAIEEKFKTTEEVALIVNEANSNYKYTGFNYTIETIPAEYKDFAFGEEAQKDAYMELNLTDYTYRMARIIDCGYSLPDSVQLRFVLEPKEGEETQEPEPFWITEAQLAEAANVGIDFKIELADKAFTAQVGDTFSVGKGLNQQKYECMDITAATPKAKVAIIENTVTASSKTTSILFNQAKQFIVNNPDEMKFREAAAQEGFSIYPAYNVTKNQGKIDQLKQSRDIVKWAFGAKEGDISDVYTCGDRFVVAMVSEVSDGEYRSIEEVDGDLRAIAIRDAKAKIMMDNLAKANSLAEAAQIANAAIDTATSVQMSGVIFGKIGMEPAVVGTAFATEAGKLSTPVKGEQGVYVLVPGQKVVAEDTEDDAAIIQQMNMQYAYYLPYRALSLLLDKAEIEDNRFNFQ